MKSKFIIKILGTLVLFFTIGINCLYAGPPRPGGGGVIGPGAPPTSPIDMYEIILFVIAIVLIFYFYKKNKLSKI
ncbi:signal peptidase [Halpernia sp.]|uniref:signal peptidase n=1 Tax=Halpernia sp. TaxID=2782209 RepID=UPI003A921A78